MTKSIIKILSLLLSLLCIMPLIVGCLNDSPNDDNDDDDDTNTTENEQEYSLDALRENYPPIYEALISYFRIDEGEVTEEMLAKVESINIESTPYSYEKDGYTLYDVCINGDRNYGGILEQRMTVDRYETMMQQLKDNNASQFILTRFLAFYNEKNCEKAKTEEAKQEMLRDYPECVEGPLYVLSTDIKHREEDELVNFLANFTDCLNNKYLSNGTVIDGNMCYAFPNLKKLRLREMEVTNAPRTITVSKFTPLNATANDIGKIEIQNSHCTYTLTYSSETDSYFINGVSNIYDQDKLNSIFDIFLNFSGKIPQYKITPQRKTNMLKNENTVTATVTLKNGESYKMHVNIYLLMNNDRNDTTEYFSFDVLYDSDDRIYPHGDKDPNWNMILKDISELKSN